MAVTKAKRARAYNKAIYAELQRRGQTREEALRVIRHFYRPLQKTFGLELNPEAFADEMLKLKHMKERVTDQTQGQTVHIRTVGPSTGIIGGYRARDSKGVNFRSNSLMRRVRLAPSAKMIIDRERGQK